MKNIFVLLMTLLTMSSAQARVNDNVYRMPGSGNLPGWGPIDLSKTAAVTGILGTAQGGTGNTTGAATTNANLTGPITSVGNATSVASQTGTGTTFVMNTSPVLVTPNLGVPSAATLTNATGLPISSGVSGLGSGVATFLGTASSANLAAALTDETGTGVAVFSTSPVLVTPNLGTPSALVCTNCSGVASGLTAGTVTTNANLTGDLTSVGNATTLATVNSNVGSFTNANITVNAKGLITAASNGTAGTGSLSAKFALEGAVIPYININGPHYQAGTQSLTAVNISMLNSGTSGSTTVQLNQYRSGSLQGSATASLSASSGNPSGANANLSGTLSLLAGDILTVDVNSVAGGTPESLTVEY